MAWCDVVEPRTLRECRIVLGQSQAAFAAMLGASPESYRTWDAGRRATPLKILARARALATHRDDRALLPLPVLALLIGVHVKTLRAAARDGRLPVTYDTRTTFRHLRARATPAGARAFRRSYYGRSVEPGDRRERARSEGGAAREQTVIGEGVEGFSQVGWRIHDDLLQRDHRRGACFPGRIPRDLELPDHLDDTVPGFGGRGRLARQHGPGGALGIDGVGLADGATRAPVAPIYFHDSMPRSAHRACQPGAIAAGAFDAERLDPPVCLGPRDQGLIATRIGHERLIAEADPPGVDRHRDVNMLVRIDPDNHLSRLGLGGHAVGHGLASSGCARRLARVGGQDCDGPGLAGPYWVTAHPVSWLPDDSPAGDDRQINSEDRWSVRLRVRPPPIGVTERPQQAG